MNFHWKLYQMFYKIYINNNSAWKLGRWQPDIAWSGHQYSCPLSNVNLPIHVSIADTHYGFLIRLWPCSCDINTVYRWQPSLPFRHYIIISKQCSTLHDNPRHARCLRFRMNLLVLYTFMVLEIKYIDHLSLSTVKHRAILNIEKNFPLVFAVIHVFFIYHPSLTNYFPLR